MADRIYRKVELVGTSSTGIEDAIQNALTAASASHDHVDWFEVQEVRGHVQDGRVGHYQVVLKVGYRLET